MNKIDQRTFIMELCETIKVDLLKESNKYPESWDGIELRWRIADVYGQVVFSDAGKRKGKRYHEYKNTVLTKNLK